VLAVLEDGR